MALIYGQLEKAQLEILSAPPASAPIGYIYYDSTLNAARVLTNAGWVDATIPSTALLVSGGTITGNLSVTGSTTLASATVSGAANVGGLATLTSGFSSSANSSFASGKGLVTPAGIIAGSLINIRSFVGSSSSVTGTYTPTDGTRMIVVEIIGGGGAGGNSGITSTINDFVRAAGAGGGGAYMRAFIKNIRPGGTLATMTYKAGNAGQKGTGSNSPGNAGGSSEFIFNSMLLRSGGGSGGSSSATGDKAYRIGSGGAGGSTLTSGSNSEVVIIDDVEGSRGGDTLAYFDQQFSQLDYVGLISQGPGGTPAHVSMAPHQFVMSYGTGQTAGGDASASARAYGVGGAGSAVVQMVSNATGGIGGAGRVLIYEYA